MNAPAQRDFFSALETDAEYKARLMQLAKELASAKYDRRLHAAQLLRKAAEDLGVLTGKEKGRRLSFIHEVFPKAGFKATDVWQRSDIPKSNRNLNRVWYLPQPETHA